MSGNFNLRTPAATLPSLPYTPRPNPVSSSSVGPSPTETNLKESVVLSKTTQIKGFGDKNKSEQRDEYAGNKVLNKTSRKSKTLNALKMKEWAALKMKEHGGQACVDSSSDDLKGTSFYYHKFKKLEIEPCRKSLRYELPLESKAQSKERTSPLFQESPHCNARPGTFNISEKHTETHRKVYEAWEDKSGGVALADLAKNSAGQQQPLTASMEKVATNNNAFQSSQDEVSSALEGVDENGFVSPNAPKATLRKLGARIEFPQRETKFSTSSGAFFSDTHALYSYYGSEENGSTEEPSTDSLLPLTAQELPTTPADVIEQGPPAKNSLKDFYNFLNSSACKEMQNALVNKATPAQAESTDKPDKPMSGLEYSDVSSDELSCKREQNSLRKSSLSKSAFSNMSGNTPHFEKKSNIGAASTAADASHNLPSYNSVGVNWGSVSSSMLPASDSVPVKSDATSSSHSQEKSFLHYGFNVCGSKTKSNLLRPRKKLFVMSEDLQTKLLPNVTVIIGSSHFKCNGLALNCYTDFFKNCHKTKFIVKLPPEKIDPKVFVTIYEWMLMDNPQLKRKGLVELYLAAVYLGIEELKAQCICCFDNCEVFCEADAFMLYKEASLYNVQNVQLSMLGRIKRFFYSLVSSLDFCELEFATVELLLKSNSIGVNHEGEILLAAVRWLNFDWEHRRIYADQIISCTRFLLVPPRQLLEISVQHECNEVVRVLQSDAIKREIMKGLTFNYNLQKKNPEEYANALKEFNIELPSKRLRVYDERCPDHYRPFHVPIEPLKYANFLAFLEYVRREGKHHWMSLQELPEVILQP